MKVFGRKERYTHRDSHFGPPKERERNRRGVPRDWRANLPHKERQGFARRNGRGRLRRKLRLDSAAQRA